MIFNCRSNNNDKTELIQYPIGNTRTSYEIPSSVISIADYAFYCCNKLDNVSIPVSVKSIGEAAFALCSGLASVTVPNSVSSIGFWAFADVGTVIYHGSLDGAPWGARSLNYYVDGWLVFTDSTKTTLFDCSAAIKGVVEIPKSVKNISEYAFFGCQNLQSVRIPDSTTIIDDSAFMGCDGLTNVTFGNNVTRIGNRAFQGCKALRQLVLPNELTSIGMYAFAQSGLQQVDIPKNVKSIGVGSFVECTSLKSVHVDGANAYFSSDEEGVLYNRNKTELIYFPAGNARSTYTVPASVKTISSCAFNSNENLKSLDIMSGTQKIEWGVFEECKSLETVQLPNTVTELCYHNFLSCKALENVTLPDSLTSLEYRMFIDCNELKYVHIPASVTSIDDGWAPLYNCGNAYFCSDTTECYAKTFADVHGIEFRLCGGHQPSDLTDQATGVNVSFPQGTYNGKVTLQVEKVLSGTAFDIVESGGTIKSSVFSIQTLVNDVVTQPNGNVTVKIPIPEGFDKSKIGLYYINMTTKKMEAVPFSVEGNYIVFTTDHFSYWTVAQIKDTPTQKSVDSISISKLPKTQYKYKDALDTSGIEITVCYSDGTTETKLSGFTVTGYNPKKVGNQTITVEFSGQTTTYSVNVKLVWWQWLIRILLFGWIWY